MLINSVVCCTSCQVKELTWGTCKLIEIWDKWKKKKITQVIQTSHQEIKYQELTGLRQNEGQRKKNRATSQSLWHFSAVLWPKITLKKKTNPHGTVGLDTVCYSRWREQSKICYSVVEILLVVKSFTGEQCVSPIKKDTSRAVRKCNPSFNSHDFHPAVGGESCSSRWNIRDVPVRCFMESEDASTCTTAASKRRSGCFTYINIWILQTHDFQNTFSFFFFHKITTATYIDMSLQKPTSLPKSAKSS